LISHAGPTTMNAADIVILAVLVLSMLAGLWRGFVSEVLSLACWVAAFWIAWAFGDHVAGWYAGFIREATACIIAGYLTCFIGVLLVGALVGWLARKMMSLGGLRGGDRLLGTLFGLARGLLLVTAAVLMLGFTPLPREAAWWRHSQLLPEFEQGAVRLASELPPDVTRYLEIGGNALPALSQVPISAVQQAARAIAAPAAAASVRPPAAGTAGRAPEHGRAPGDVGQ
jgi:membrane protein required for colicin V production